MENAISFPPWFNSLFQLQNEIKHPLCFKHNNIKTSTKQISQNYFCTDCHSRICELCMNEDHNNCKVLKKIFQLRFGTPEGNNKDLKQLSIQVEELQTRLQKRRIPLTLVRDFKFNNKQVYYIFKRPSKKTNTFGCKICNHQFEDDQFMYCSLQCLVESISGKISQVQASVTSIKNEVKKSASINLKSGKRLKVHKKLKCVIDKEKTAPLPLWNFGMRCLQKRKSRSDLSKIQKQLDSIQNLSSGSNSQLDSTTMSPSDNSDQPKKRNRRKQSTPIRSPHNELML